MNNIVDVLKKYGIVPVIKLENVADAKPLAVALLNAGLPIAEITFRTHAAVEIISLLNSEFPSLFVGAGTVTTVEQIDAAQKAGAKFIVTPGFNPRIVDACIERRIPVIPGVNSPSQIEQGLERGLTVLKFFPAEASGGIKMLKALQGPYSTVSFVPTGGVDESNLAQYLGLQNVLAVGGSWMVKENLIASSQFDLIESLCKEALEQVHKIRG